MRHSAMLGVSVRKTNPDDIYGRQTWQQNEETQQDILRWWKLIWKEKHGRHNQKINTEDKYRGQILKPTSEIKTWQWNEETSQKIPQRREAPWKDIYDRHIKKKNLLTEEGNPMGHFTRKGAFF